MLSLPSAMRTPGYARQPEWIESHDLQRTSWLCVPSTKELRTPAATAIIVGRVSQHRTYLGTHGNYFPNSSFGSLASARYQLILECPHEDPKLEHDWQTAINQIRDLQNQKIGNEPVDDQRVFIIGGGNSVRLSAPVFEHKKYPEKGAERGEKIENWWVPEALEKDLQGLCNTHRALPLNVFDENLQPVSPRLIPQKVIGSLVEVKFTMKHFRRLDKGHGFTAIIFKILILDSG